MDCRTLRWHLQDLVNKEYLREFVLNPKLPSEVRVQRQPEAPAEHPGSTLVQCQEVNVIFGNSPIEGTTTKERTLYVNEARRDNHLATVTRPPTSPGRLVFFLEEDSYVVHFSQNDTLVLTAHIGRCKVSKILVDGGSSVNILYGHALDRMENTPELARKLIIPQTQSLLYGFDRNEARSPGMVEFPVRADPFNVVTEFNILDVPSPIMPFLKGHRSI